MHTHPHILLTQAKVHMHAQVAREPQWGVGSGWSRIWYQLETGGPENLSVAGQARAKIKTKAEHRINVGCSEKTG